MIHVSFLLLVAITARTRADGLQEAKRVHPYFENERTFEPVGCFHDSMKQRALPLLLVNFRNNGLDWKNLQQVVRDCAEAVKSAGYVYFSIQFWGECWSGEEAHKTYDMYGSSRNGCQDNTWGREMHNYVYRLTGSPEHECHSKVYRTYNQTNRSRFAGPGSLCDYSRKQHKPGWYRFSGAAGLEMATSCIVRGHCSTVLPGWYKGSKPRVLEKEATKGEGCFSSATNTADSENCCDKRYTVPIFTRNCGRFTVWNLPQAIGCDTRYCGNGTLSQQSKFRY